MLVEKYAEEQLVPRSKASDAEINEYLAKHPKMTPEQARAKADGWAHVFAGDPTIGKATIEGTAVEKAKPLYEVVSDIELKDEE